MWQGLALHPTDLDGKSDIMVSKYGGTTSKIFAPANLVGSFSLPRSLVPAPAASEEPQPFLLCTECYSLSLPLKCLLKDNKQSQIQQRG